MPFLTMKRLLPLHEGVPPIPRLLSLRMIFLMCCPPLPQHYLHLGKSISGLWKCCLCTCHSSTTTRPSPYLSQGNWEGLQVVFVSYYPNENERGGSFTPDRKKKPLLQDTRVSSESIFHLSHTALCIDLACIHPKR